MPRRIDVELTSRRDDGSWTWRAAGAREPRGTLDGGLLPEDAKVGTVIRAEVEMDVDGIVVTGVLTPKAARQEPERLEIIGPRRDDRLVTTSLARREPHERRSRRDGDRDRDRRPRGEGEGRPARPRDGGERRGRPPFERKPPLEPKPKAKRLRPGRAHRQALIASLPEEQRPVAEELARGGVPGVRAALDRQNEQSRAEGRPEVDPTPLMTLAEQLWPRMRTAEWRDRAEAALRDVDEIDLRDLRSVVVAADSAARDDETREMATQLREALSRRVDEEHTKWLVELAELVADGRVVAALRRSSRPPKAGAPLPPELASTLAEKTTESLNADVAPQRWAVLLDALAYSPVRTSVNPPSVPAAPGDELLAALRKVAARVPHIAALFGVEAEAPAPPGRGGRRARPGGRSGPSGENRRERPASEPAGEPGAEGPEGASAEARDEDAGPVPGSGADDDAGAPADSAEVSAEEVSAEEVSAEEVFPETSGDGADDGTGDAVPGGDSEERS